MTVGPNPSVKHPMPMHPRVGLLEPLTADRENVEIGDFTYCDDPAAPGHFNHTMMVRTRLGHRTVDSQLAFAGGNWPVEKIGRNLDAIRGADIETLEKAA